MRRNYTYEVVSVDETVKQMVINYSADGVESVVVCMPIPSVGDTVEDVVTAYAPFAVWDEQVREVIQVAAGTSGVVEHTEPEASDDSEQASFVDDFEPVTYKLI
jgi:hypothetical protein